MHRSYIHLYKQHALTVIFQTADVARALISFNDCSFEGLSLGADGSSDHVAVNGLNVGDLADDHGPVLLLCWRRVDGVADEHNGAEVGQL